MLPRATGRKHGRCTVSILTRTEVRVLHGREQRYSGVRAVSILTRTEVRVLPQIASVAVAWNGIVSILTRTEVRVLRDATGVWELRELVSILTRTEVRVLPDDVVMQQRGRVVSILTRTEVRVLRRLAFMVLKPEQFQSSPAPRYGCC